MRKIFLRDPSEKISWVACSHFFAAHLLPLAAIFTGVKISDFILCLVLYFMRMFFITAGYHRYFAHRSYQLNRVIQFIMAFGGGTSAQKGALWWAAHHRHHHRYSDTQEDIHSPKKGFWWSHMGWIVCSKYDETRYDLIPDFAKYPELRWLNKYHLVPPTLLAIAVLFWGGGSALWIGFFLSTVLLWHGTFVINSLAHVFGRRRFVTTDTSRNSFLLSMITLGEGWHNNHHHFQAAARQGFYWWEMDISFYILKLLKWMKLAKNLKKVPSGALKRNLIKDGNFDVGMMVQEARKKWIKPFQKFQLPLNSFPVKSRNLGVPKSQ